MHWGGIAKVPYDIKNLKSLNFDFAEIMLSSSVSRRKWWESGIKSEPNFPLIGQGPGKWEGTEEKMARFNSTMSKKLYDQMKAIKDDSNPGLVLTGRRGVMDRIQYIHQEWELLRRFRPPLVNLELRAF